MVIYTKRGDKGETSMFDEDSSQRERVSKDSLRVEALGAIDELNSYLGVAIASFNEKYRRHSEFSSESKGSKILKQVQDDRHVIKFIKNIQRNLLTIGSITAGSKLRFSSAQTKRLEGLIDKLEGSLPVLKNFIIPGGSIIAAHLQYARALARRAERRMVAVSKEEVKPQVLQYLNRLSDALFMLAREENYKEGIKDEIWLGSKR